MPVSLAERRPKSLEIIGDLKVRYFFHVAYGRSTIDDAEGTVLSGPDVAMLQAAVIAPNWPRMENPITDTWSA